MLIEKLRQDLKEGMKEKNVVKKSVAQVLISAIRKKEIDDKITVTPEDEVIILNKELKQLNETLEMALKSPEGHEQIIEETKGKIELVKTYLPEQMSEEELKPAIMAEIAKLNLEEISPKAKGIIMKNIMPVFRGKVDGKLIDKVVNEIVNG